MQSPPERSYCDTPNFPPWGDASLSLGSIQCAAFADKFKNAAFPSPPQNLSTWHMPNEIERAVRGWGLKKAHSILQGREREREGERGGRETARNRLS
jgi:hypothetical protein